VQRDGGDPYELVPRFVEVPDLHDDEVVFATVDQKVVVLISML
jgi:hypothetical protein